MSSPRYILVVNAGNTRVSAAVVCLSPSHAPAVATQVRVQEGAGPCEASSVADLLRDATADARPSGAVLVNVRPGADVVVEGAVRDVLGLALHRLSSADLGSHHYRTPQTLGPDRIANVLGYRACCGQGPGIVVDAGTATTFECIDASGAFVGGPIAAGLMAALDGLLLRAPGLPRPEAQDWIRAPRLAQGSLDAVAAGALHGHLALISGLASSLASDLHGLTSAGRPTAGAPALGPAATPELPSSAIPSTPRRGTQRILCGGFAEVLAPHLAREGFKHLPHLTLVGAATVLSPARQVPML